MLILCLFLQLACSAPEDEFTPTLKTSSSWAATARMVGEEWQRESVPNAYAAQTLHAARQALQKELNETGNLDADSRARLQSLTQIVGEMQAAIERSDRQAVAELLNMLDAKEGAFKQMNNRACK